ncbi:MAG TPA: sugar transferase [Euzebya sp.]|nr:sugar transferase [Euzebya sp.]
MSAVHRPYDLVKRAMDVVGAGIGLVLLGPVMAGVAVAVRWKLGAPVLFRQQRPGKDGRLFTLYKFRTMLEGEGPDQQRLTPLGQTLRATSLDELPELVNVLRGDMSLVGPRPLLPSYLPLYSPTQARRHEVRPGLTGLAQISGRNDIGWQHRLAMDVDYVDRRSLFLDLSILARTIAAVLRRAGISHGEDVTMPPFRGDPDGD